MTDIERGRIGGGDEDRLPWLEPVEDEQPETGVGAGKLIAAVIVALVAIGLVIGGIFWLREGSGPGELPGDGDLIAAPAGDYKVPPAQAGGMAVQGEGDATFAASQGVPVDAAIDISKQPEAPMAGNARSAEPVRTTPLPASTAAPATVPALKPAPAPVKTATAPTAKPTPVEPVKVAPKPVPAKPVEVAKPAEKPATGGGPTVQLGAFGSEAKANAAWAGLAGRFPALKSLSHSVTLAEVGGKKLYRLRASAGSGAKASSVCRALTSAKEPCNVVG